jgi:hypothetical protein
MVNRIGTPINFDCPEGDAVFYNRLIYPSSVAGIGKEALKQLTNYFEHIGKLNDDRLIVLTAELLLENTIDRYLSAIMPSYKNTLGDNRDFTFSLKIAVAKGLKLSPSKFFKSVDLVRKVRNEFVHNLNIKSFDKLDIELLNDIQQNLELYTSKERVLSRELRDNFKSLALYSFWGLNAQIENIQSLNAYLRSNYFLEDLSTFLQQNPKQRSKP